MAGNRVVGDIVDEAVALAQKVFGVSSDDAAAAIELARREYKGPPVREKITGADLLKRTEGMSEDPLGFSKFSKPFPEMEYTVDKFPKEPYKPLNPHDLVKEDALIAGHISDRTAGGRDVIDIGGVPLTEPLRQRGGVDYQRTTPHAWANRQGAAKGLNRKLNEAAEDGSPVYTTPVFMGTSSANSSHMVGVPLIRMIPNMPISTADKLAFDAMMSERFPGWPGINNTKAAEEFMYSGKIPGSAITNFVKYASAKKWRAAGFPDVSEVMFSSMDPRLVGVKQGSTGMGFKEFKPGEDVIIKGENYHPDYPASIPGKEYAGGFKYQLPQNLMFPDWWNSLKPELRLPENATMAQHTLMTQVPVQRATNKWADDIEKYWEENPIPWGYADGGSVEDDGDIFDALRLAGEIVSTGINRYFNPIRRAIGVETGELPEGVQEVDYGDLYRQARDADYGDLYRRAMDAIDSATLYFGGADPEAKRPMKNPVSPTGKIVDRVPETDPDIQDAMRIAKDVGGGAGAVFMTDANGIQYDAQGNVIAGNGQKAPEQNVNSPPPEQKMTPEEVGRRAADNPATFDYLMNNYAVPDTDIARYEGMVKEVGKQPQEVQQMTHTGAAPTREMKVDMPLLGGEKTIGKAPYNVAGPLAGAAQAAYDLKTVPFYFFPPTAGAAMAADVAEGVATGDPLQAGLAIATGPGNKFVKAAGIGLSSYAMDPAQAQAGPERWYSKLFEVANALPMEKMAGDQALAMLRKAAPLEEIRWTGTDKFLAQNPQVTKQALLDYIQKNRVQPKEITLGGKPTSIYDVTVPDDLQAKYGPQISDIDAKLLALAKQREASSSAKVTFDHPDYISEYTYRQERDGLLDDKSALEEQMRKEAVERIGGLGAPTKFHDYSTPGGEGYRETLYQRGSYDQPKVMEKDRMWHVVDANGETMRNSSGGPYSYYTQGDAERAARSLYRQSGSYASPHWNDPDVFLHTRSQTLGVEVPGANRPYKAHNVDETQSDLAQAGRKQGFKDQDAMAAAARLRQQTEELRARYKAEQERLYAEHQERIAPYVAERNRYEEELRQKYKSGELSLGEMNRLAEAYQGPEAELAGKHRAAMEEVLTPIHDRIVANEAEIERIGKNIGKMPLMPYVSNTEAWTDFAIKKELDRALDNDSDYFTWTPGEVHADRYNLSKHIGKLEYNPDTESLIAYDPQGQMVVNERASEDQLDDYVGKELADKLRNEYESRRSGLLDAMTISKTEDGEWGVFMYGEPMYEYGGEPVVFGSKGEANDYISEQIANDLSNNPIELSGLDLKVGGEGMLGYYNKIYAKRVEKVIEKATGKKPKIETITVQTADGPRQQLGVRLDEDMQNARFSDFKKGGRVTGKSAYDNSKTVDRALALTREF